MTCDAERQELSRDVIARMVRDVDTRPFIGGLALYATILAAVVMLEVFF